MPIRENARGITVERCRPPGYVIQVSGVPTTRPRPTLPPRPSPLESARELEQRMRKPAPVSQHREPTRRRLLQVGGGALALSFGGLRRASAGAEERRAPV